MLSCDSCNADIGLIHKGYISVVQFSNLNHDQCFISFYCMCNNFAINFNKILWALWNVVVSVYTNHDSLVLMPQILQLCCSINILFHALNEEIP